VLYIGHPRKAGTAGDDAASSVSDTHSGSDQIVNAVRNVFYVMRDTEALEDGSPSPFNLLLRDKSNVADWNGPWGMKFATIGDTYEGNILDEDGKPKAEGTLRVTGVKWIERCDRDPGELIREARAAQRQGADEKWTDAARLILQTLLAGSPHPVKGDQMKRVAQDAGHAPTSATWKRAKTWLQNAQLIETGKGPIADWKLGSGCSPLDGDAGRLRKAAGHLSTAEEPLAGADGPPAHFAAIPPADGP
jgi:hypothetical protein